MANFNATNKIRTVKKLLETPKHESKFIDT